MISLSSALKATLLLLTALPPSNALPATSDSFNADTFRHAQHAVFSGAHTAAVKVYDIVHSALTAPTPAFFETKDTVYPRSACNYVKRQSPPGLNSYGFQLGVPYGEGKMCAMAKDKIATPRPRGRGDIELLKWRCEDDGSGNLWIGFRVDARVDEKMMIGRVRESVFMDVFWLGHDHCVAQKDELKRVKELRTGKSKRHEVPLPDQVGIGGHPLPVISYKDATCTAEHWRDGSVRYNMNVGLPFLAGQSCPKLRWAIEHPSGKEYFKLMHWECEPAGYGYTYLSIGVDAGHKDGVMKSLEDGWAQAGQSGIKLNEKDICRVRSKDRTKKDLAPATGGQTQKPT